MKSKIKTSGRRKPSKLEVQGSVARLPAARFNDKRDKNKYDKYDLYQISVQDPPEDIQIYDRIYQKVRGQAPRVLREDFCGTFAFSCAWVMAHEQNTALALDLDDEPLAYGRRKNLVRLSAQQKRRLHVLKQNVMSVTSPPADLLVANNFSFYIFKERAVLVRYFKSVLKSLSKQGLFILEMAGGAEMMTKDRQQKVVKDPALGKFTYIWQHKRFNPISNNGVYAIHFKFADGTFVKDAFVYDWRLWSIPEVRDCLREAGFKTSHVFWEKTKGGGPTGEHEAKEVVANDTFWLSYIVGEP